ncbi:DUF1700 domain-containing protein [Streptococcus suis]|nr:DUF1700 domain-containing protein [Streptococcus suis]
MMTRADYMNQLAGYLKRLPQEDFHDAMEHFNEYFDEAGPENEDQVIAELGSPKHAASDILANLYEKEVSGEKPSTSNRLLLVTLSILAAPMGLILGLVVLALFVSLILLVLALVLAMASICIALISLGISGFLSAFELFTTAISSGILVTGLSLIGIALGILGIKATIFIGHKLLQASLHFIQQLLPKGDRYETA